MPPEILTITALQSDVQAELEARFNVHRLDRAAELEGLLDAVGGEVRAVVTDGGETVDATLLARLPRLEFISCASAGHEGIDTSELARRGIRMKTVSAALEDDVADTALMLLLSARRDLPRAHTHVTQGGWESREYPLQRSFSGGTIGIAGFGCIGQAVARRAAGFGKQVGYVARGPKPGVAHRYFDDLTELAAWSDELVICLPGGAATRHLVGASVLEALGPGGVLVNVGRGSVVDEESLVAALTLGRLGAAGLDVFENEPSPDPRLTRLANVTCYPHHASGTQETREAMARLALENLLSFFADAD